MKFLRSILSNLATLLLAFILAIIIWINAIQVQDPIRSDSLQIPVEFVGQPDNSRLLTPDRESVLIGLEGPVSVLNQLTIDDFTATVDLGQVPFGQELPVDVEVQSSVDQVTILSQSPQQINVRLEQLVRREIPVVLDIRGGVARGHSQGEPLIDPQAISVVGTASQVEPLNFARVTVFLNNDRETVVDTPQPIFYDQQGRVASVSGLTLSTERVEVTIPVNVSADFAEKLISPRWTGEPAPGYRLLNVSVDPPSVLVKGLPSQLTRLTRVQTEPIDITGLTETFEQQVALDLPTGVTLDEVEEVFVTIEIEPILTTDTYIRIPELQGLAQDLEAVIEPEEIRVVLFGPLPVLDALPEEEVHVTIDLFGLDVGTYSLEPDVDFPDRGIELRSLQPSSVTVHISKTITATNGLTDTESIRLPLPPSTTAARQTGVHSGINDASWTPLNLATSLFCLSIKRVCT